MRKVSLFDFMIRSNIIYYLILIYLSIVMASCIWNIINLFIPSTIFLIVIFSFMLAKKENLRIDYFEFLLFILLLNEMLSLLFSVYPFNSIKSYIEFATVIFSSFLFGRIISNKKIEGYIVLIISSLLLIISLINTPIFIAKYLESKINGFDDFSQLRHLYHPMGLPSNEWITIMLCLIPFPVIGYFISVREGLNKYSFSFFYHSCSKYFFLFIILMSIFNIFICFSRSGFISLILFIVFINIQFVAKKIITIKKIIFVNILLISLLGVFVICFNSASKSTIKPTTTHQRSVQGRFIQWENAKNVFLDNLATGVGSKNYALIQSNYQDVSFDTSFSPRVNNSYLQILVEKGIVFTIPWVIFIIFVVYMSLKRASTVVANKIVTIVGLSAIISIMFRDFFFSSLLYNNGILMLFFILISFTMNSLDFTVKIKISSKKYFSFICIIIILMIPIYIYNKYTRSVNDYTKLVSSFENDTIDNPNSTSSDNSLYNAIMALKYERGMKHSKDSISNIRNSILYYKKAIEINPYDGLFYHNLAWLYHYDNCPDIALDLISKAINISPNTALYYISRGLINESKHFEKSLEDYKIAIMLSPDICDSYFFKELKMRHETYSNKILEHALSDLYGILSDRYSSIIEAKIAKILLTQNEFCKAYKILNNITDIHPNLNRPWLYLAILEEYLGSDKNKYIYLKKSEYLGPNDYLPVMELANHFQIVRQNKKYVEYKKLAIGKYYNKKSVHSLHTNAIYRLPNLKNDIIPEYLLDYINPILNLKSYD